MNDLPNDRDRMIATLVLHSADIPDAIGLLTGQTGIVIAVVNYARRFGMSWLEEAADFLVDNITRRIRRMSACGFSSGLAGIGWGVEYLIQKGFMEGDSNEILADVDRRIMRTDIRFVDDRTLDTGTPGLWQYVWARIQGNLISGNTLPFDSLYLKGWIDVLSADPASYPEGACGRLKQAVGGSLIPMELNPCVFIGPVETTTSKMCLKGGLAGYILQQYLSQP